MISFENFTPEDGIPIYYQIVRHIKRGIAAGAVTDGDEVPSRRVLSALLGVNPNTIQKAYSILEEEGLMCSHAGAKSYMSLDEEHIAKVREELLRTDAEKIVKALRGMGLTLESAIKLIENYWSCE